MKDTLTNKLAQLNRVKKHYDSLKEENSLLNRLNEYNELKANIEKVCSEHHVVFQVEFSKGYTTTVTFTEAVYAIPENEWTSYGDEIVPSRKYIDTLEDAFIGLVDTLINTYQVNVQFLTESNSTLNAYTIANKHGLDDEIKRLIEQGASPSTALKEYDLL